MQACNEGAKVYCAVCFIDDNPALHGKLLNGIPVVSLDAERQRFPAAAVVGGIGAPQTRQRLMEKATVDGFGCETIVHSRVERSEWIEIGVGTAICAGNILTTNITFGRHVQINLDCTIGHDVAMGDYTTLVLSLDFAR